MGVCPPVVVLLTEAASGAPSEHATACTACEALLRAAQHAARESHPSPGSCDEAEVWLAAVEDVAAPDTEAVARLFAHLRSCAPCRQRAAADVAWLDTAAALELNEPAAPRPLPAQPDATGDLDDLIDVSRTVYRRERPIARGGMGQIIEARDRRAGRTVALKEIRAELLGGSTATADRLRARFEREARITARLQHPSIVPVYEIGRFGDTPFYAMKLVNGRPLDRVVREAETLSERLALLPELLAVAEALAYAHEQGIVHRDLKPSNVLVGSFGETVVIDWGLAKDLRAEPTPAPVATGGGDVPAQLDAPSEFQATQSVAPEDVPAGVPTSNEALTVAGHAMGTPAYMPPEQARGEPVDERADVYALGAMLYYLLAGRPPFAPSADSEDPVRELLDAVIEGAPTPLLEIDPAIPRDLVSIVERAMSRDPDDRFPTAAELATELSSYQTGQLVATHDYTFAELTRRWLRKHRAPLTVAAAMLALLVAVGIVGIRRIVAERNAARAARDDAEASQRNAEIEARRARDAQRLATARRALTDGEPRIAAVLMREVEKKNATVGWQAGAAAMLFSRARPATVVLRGHEGTTHRASFSADGRHIVTASSDGTARIWRTNGAGPVAILRGHEDVVFSAAFSRDGERVVTASADGTARIWHTVGTGDPVILPHNERVVGAGFSPDGDNVVTASDDGIARIWSADGTGKPRVLAGHRPGWLTVATFSPAGDRVLTASVDGTVRIWSTDGATDPVVFDPDRGPARTAAFSPDGTRIIAGFGDGTALVWNADGTGAPIVLNRHAGRVRAAVFSPDGARVLTASEDRTCRIWNASRGEVLVVLRGHTDYVWSAVFSPDGTRVLTASADKTARLWDARGSGAITVFTGHNAPVYSAVFDSSGERVVTASRDRTARVWSAEDTGAPVVLTLPENDVASDPEQLGVARVLRWIHKVEFSPDGAQILALTLWGALLWNADGTGDPIMLSHDGAIAAEFSPSGDHVLTASPSTDLPLLVWNRDHLDAPVVLRPRGTELRSAAFSQDGDRIVTGSTDGTLCVVRTDGEGEPLVLARHDGVVTSAVFSPNGGHVVATTDRGAVLVMKADGTGDTVVLEGHRDSVRARFSPDGEHILTVSHDGTARLWRADGTGEPVLLEPGSGALLSAAFSPDATHFATGAANGTVRVWNTEDTRNPIVLDEHVTKVRAVAFSPDGMRVVSSSEDWTARVWTADGAGDVIVLSGHGNSVLSAMFSPDGSRVVTGSADGTARVWPLGIAGLHEGLWSATRDCLSVEERRTYLGLDEAEARAEIAACKEQLSARDEERRAASAP